MFEYAIAFVIASIAGIIGGLVPGVNIFVMSMILLPYFLTIDPVTMVMMYVVMCSIDQYFGSVSGTFFAVPGASTSLPSVYEGHTLYRKGQGDQAIMYAAIGSFIGSVFAAILTLILMNYMFVFYNMFDTRIKSFLLLTALLLFAYITKNKLIVNIVFIIAGLLLGHVGVDKLSNTSFLTFGIPQLSIGIPTISVVLGLYIIPMIVSNMTSTKQVTSFTKISFSGYWHTLKQMTEYKWLILRSSIIGYLGGFFPGISYHLGSAISYSTERRMREKNGKYQEGDLGSLLAAETANNAGVYSCIIPLLMVGLPITPLQAVLYDIMEAKGYDMSLEFLQSMLPLTLLGYVLSAFVGVYLAGKYVNWISFISKFNVNSIYMVVLLILVWVTWYIGSQQYAGGFYLIVLAVLTPIGLILKRYDKLPLVFAFTLSGPIYSSIQTFNALYF